MKLFFVLFCFEEVLKENEELLSEQIWKDFCDD